ncbi:MAG: carboxypeptidase-like regulatory domain-containing protein, partial [Candidatus Acidiferrales bacterium]
MEKFLPRKVAADQNGVFTFEGLPVTGDYRLEAESPGFQQSYVITMIDTAQQRAEFKGKPYSYLAKQSFVSI